MQRKRLLIFAFIATLSITNASHLLKSWDKELIYDWQALIKAGTNLPATYASQLVLHGKIHLQTSNNSLFVKIENLSHKLYNGILDHNHENQARDLPLPDEMQDLQHVFQIVYNPDGSAEGIVTAAEEKEFSRNIKRAIATIFQVNIAVFKKDYPHSQAFVVKENSIYGYGKVLYNVFPRENATIEVHKSQELNDPRELSNLFVTNSDFGRCDLKYEQNLVQNSQKKYVIAREDIPVVKSIVTSGAVIYSPFESRSDAQFILVSQTFDLVDRVPIQQRFQIESDQLDHLTYHAFERPHDGGSADVTNGRHIVNYEKLIPIVREMLEDISQYLQENHIHTKPPDSKRGQLVNRVQRLLMTFNIEKLKELQNTLSDDALEIFYHTLPLVGTEAAIVHVKNLVVDKAVDDATAVELLQHMWQNVKPPVRTLQKLEELIYLNESISWNVRKVAILTFGSLIHKSYIAKRPAGNRKKSLEVYDKYVNEFVEKFVNSSDHKVQLMYALALHNTKLPSIVKLLLPAFNGELWSNQHLRFVSMWAASPAIVSSSRSDPDLIMETLWPIFANPDELTEMRCVAYYYIMQSQPSHSRLTDMASLLLTDRDTELYHFHYTYMQALVQSKDPCIKEMRVKLAQMLKFSPPPSHGVSSATFHDYTDANHGFGAMMEKYFLKTNRSRIHAYFVTSQKFNLRQEEFMVYVKVHDGRNEDRGFYELLDDLRTRLHVEIGILKRGQLLNIYFINENNVEDLMPILELFADTWQMSKKLLYMSYNWYHRSLFPTDLGVPATWEFLEPSVYQISFNFSNHLINNDVNIQVDGKVVTWGHYRHGLTFYNPVSDLWQGINRYHSYDSVFPLNFNLTLNTQTVIAQLSWIKHESVERNIAGFRSHVKQMVFVRDNYNGNILAKSSPHAKRYQIVNDGVQDGNEYTLMDQDDLNSGHKVYVGVYDSDNYFSNRSLKQLFSQPSTKHANSFRELLWLSLDNWMGYIQLLPDSGKYGFIVKIEPSHEYNVSKIVLFFSFERKNYIDKNHFPRLLLYSLLKYKIVNDKQEILKGWNLTGIFDIMADLSASSVKLFLSRVIPGHNDYKICLEGEKIWNKNGVVGILNVLMGETTDSSRCPANGKIQIAMTGQRSLEQKTGHHKYESCQYVVPYTIPYYYTFQCLVDHSTVRHYVYNVKTINVPDQFKKVFVSGWDKLKTYYESDYTCGDNHNDTIQDGNLKIDVVYPMRSQEVNVQVTTHQNVYSLTVPTKYCSSFGAVPDSLAYSQLFLNPGWMNRCVVHPDHLYFNDELVSAAVPKHWSLFVGHTYAYNVYLAIYLKEIATNTIGAKVVRGSHSLEVVPDGEGYKISVDGQVTTDKQNLRWIYYDILEDQNGGHSLVVSVPDGGIYFVYDAHHVVFVTSKMIKVDGHCHKQQVSTNE